MVKNYLNRRNIIAGDFKRERFTLEVGDELPAGIVQLAKVYIAKKRKLKVGDKMAVVTVTRRCCRIVRDEDMPFLEDGTPVDICLNPLGVPSRMNLGQLYEAVWAWAGSKIGSQICYPSLMAHLNDVSNELKEAGLPDFGRTQLYDGLTGQKFDQPVTVGVAYISNSATLVDDKMHARSIRYTRSSRNSRWVVRHSSVVSASERWKFGLSRHWCFAYPARDSHH